MAIKTEGNNIGDSLQLMSIMWFVNFFALLIMYWGGTFCLKELKMEWMETPLYATITSLVITKCILMIFLINALLKRFKVDP